MIVLYIARQTAFIVWFTWVHYTKGQQKLKKGHYEKMRPDKVDSRIPILSISNNLEELISEPTHIRDDGSQSCIDLIFTHLK